MQLTKIKLSGFKSFVEKTEINFSKRRTGIVGPNGCGKSNIIDAIRWVLGESRATELRGDSLQDIIFNGSSSRHRAGRASVELIFDNPDGKISGPWGEFADISVKRTVTSDGQTNSFINDRNVRRKDILDLFLGTGLGPKSYAIIGQGMIGKIINSKPEELRVFLEEASGVSKYRQRRKETESRLSDGRDSMSRISDLILELDDRASNLALQAKTAENFHEISKAKNNLQLFLLCKKKESIDRLIASGLKELDTVKFENDKLHAAIKTVELELTSNRNKANLLQKELDENNQNYFKINNEISKEENQSRLTKEKILHAENVMSNASMMINNIDSSIELEKENLSNLEKKLSYSNSEISKKNIFLDDFKNKITPIKESLEKIQTNYTEARAEFAVLESEKINFEIQIKSLLETKSIKEIKINEMKTELDSMENVSESKIEELNKFSHVKSEEVDKAKSKLHEKQEENEEAKIKFEALNSEYNKIEKKTLELSAEYSGLVSIQKKLLDLDSLENWLISNKLSNLPSLVSLIKVNPEWKVAVESVLNNRLASFQIDSIKELSNMDNKNAPASVTFFNAGNTVIKNKLNFEMDEYQNLSFAIESENEASKFACVILHDFYCITSISEGIKNKYKLNLHSKFVTPEGNIIGQSDLYFHSKSSAVNLIEREEKIDKLKKEINGYEVDRSNILTKLNTAKENFDFLSSELEKTRNFSSVCIQDAHQAELKIAVLKEKSDSINERKFSLNKEIDSLKNEVLKTESDICLNRDNQAKNQEDIELSQIKLDQLNQNLISTTTTLSGLNDESKNLEESLQFLKLEQRSIVESKASIIKRIDDFEESKSKSKISRQSANQEIEKLNILLSHNKISDLLGHQKTIEEKLKLSRNSLELKNSEILIQDEKRLTINRDIVPLRDKISKLEIEKSRLIGISQELNATILKSGLENPNEKNQITIKNREYEKLSVEQIEKQITKLSKEIDNLGMVNLAAIEELEEVTQRKNNFVIQLNDLQNAEKELSEAIKRMDIETKDLLRKTFVAVNSNLKIYFKSLFGGGTSELLFLEDDILNSGMKLMSQPPGKKITRVQQLSGGEQSLAALALVFSFFKLNPAPFCILDEADAALDEANTLGLNKLLNNLSDLTQFIFITHNKALMDIAEQLIGITMQELGVSRAVSVDLKSAESWIEEAA